MKNTTYKTIERQCKPLLAQCLLLLIFMNKAVMSNSSISNDYRTILLPTAVGSFMQSMWYQN